MRPNRGMVTDGHAAGVLLQCGMGVRGRTVSAFTNAAGRHGGGAGKQASCNTNRLAFVNASAGPGDGHLCLCKPIGPHAEALRAGLGDTQYLRRCAAAPAANAGSPSIARAVNRAYGL